jgi:hypothetical protein
MHGCWMQIVIIAIAVHASCKKPTVRKGVGMSMNKAKQHIGFACLT